MQTFTSLSAANSAARKLFNLGHAVSMSRYLSNTRFGSFVYVVHF